MFTSKIEQAQQELEKIETELRRNANSFSDYGKVITLCITTKSLKRAHEVLPLGMLFFGEKASLDNIADGYKYVCAVLELWKEVKFNKTADKKDTSRRINLSRNAQN